jgi:hypothetical protein
MPLYRVIFQEQGGYHCTCRIRAAAGAEHVTLAVQKIWGQAAFWEWAPWTWPHDRGHMWEEISPHPSYCF